MNNKKVVETFMEGYNTGDNAKILSCLTEDVIWEMAGSFNLKGKDQFDKEINNGLGRQSYNNNITTCRGRKHCGCRRYS